MALTVCNAKILFLLPVPLNPHPSYFCEIACRSCLLPIKNVLQKLDLEIHGHQPIVEKVVSTGEKLIDQKHYNSKQIKDKCQELQVSWDDLLNKSKIRKKNLDLSVQIQKVWRSSNPLVYVWYDLLTMFN